MTKTENMIKDLIWDKSTGNSLYVDEDSTTKLIQLITSEVFYIEPKDTNLVYVNLKKLEKKLREDIIECDCEHNVPEEFAHSNDEAQHICANCLIDYMRDTKSSEIEDYAKFCVTCDRDGLPVITFKDYLKQYGDV